MAEIRCRFRRHGHFHIHDPRRSVGSTVDQNPLPRNLVHIRLHEEDPRGRWAPVYKIADGILFRAKPSRQIQILLSVGKFDRVHCKRPIVKIAYELASEWLGMGYLEDYVGEKLRRYVVDSSFTLPPVENSVNGKIDFPAISNLTELLSYRPCTHTACIRLSDLHSRSKVREIPITCWKLKLLFIEI